MKAVPGRSEVIGRQEVRRGKRIYPDMKWKPGSQSSASSLAWFLGASLVWVGHGVAGATPTAAARKAAAAHCTEGMRLKRAGKLAAAAHQFEMALSVWPDNVEAHWALAWTYAAQGLTRKAGSHFRRVIALSPGSTRAVESRKALARLDEPPGGRAAPDNPDSAAPATTAAGVLEHCLAAYAGVDTLAAQGTYGIDFQADHPVQRLLPVTLAYKRPNRFRVEFHDEVYGSTLVSDGKTLTTYLPILKEYARVPAPPSLSFRPRGVQAFLTGPFFPAPIQFLAAENPLAVLKRDQAGLRLVGRETLHLGEPSTRVATYHVRLAATHPPAGTMGVAVATTPSEFWVDTATFMIRKYRHELAPEAVKGNPRYAALGPEGRLIVTETYFSVRVDEPVSETLFVFTPPPAARFVDAIQLAGRQVAGADLTGVRAPGFSLRSAGGQRYALHSYLNQPVVLCFWNSGVAGCRELLPLLDRLQRDYDSQHLTVLTITLNLGNHSADLAQQLGVRLPLLCDPHGDVTREYAAFVQPVLVFLDKLGIVRAVLRGPQSEKTVREGLAAIGVR